MDEILQKYDSFKIEECIYLLNKESRAKGSLVESIVKQNCMNVCQCLLIIAREDLNKIDETHLTLFKTYQNIVATGLPGKLVPVQLELTAFFNFIWWNLHYAIISKNQDTNIKMYLPIIQRGLRRVVGISCKVNNYVKLTEDILCDIKCIEKKMFSKDYWSVSLLLEVIVLIILYILKIDNSKCIMEQCLTSLKAVIGNCKVLINGLAAVKNFEEPNLLFNKFFKFGVLKLNSKVSDPSTSSIDCLYIVKAVCFFYLKKYENIMLDMKENMKSSVKPLWCYLGGLSSLMLDDLSQCLGFVIMSESLNFGNSLKSRFKILHGLLFSKKGDYKESLKCFGEAKRICPSNKSAFYYMGEEYGKMGLNDEMVECFKTLVKVKEKEKVLKTCQFHSNFESIVLNLLHPVDEVSDSEVAYAAAIAFGINEKFEEAIEMFEKYFEVRVFEKEYSLDCDRIIKTPSMVTAMHEAAVMNIQIGNFLQSEQLLSKASNHYTIKERTELKVKNDVHVKKDVNWIRKVLDKELGIPQKTNEENESMYLFTEEMVHFFEVDVIALMLSAEIDLRTERDSYKSTLGRLISIFSKYLARMQKQENIEEEEKIQLTLVKALSCKTCLDIAKCQIKGKLSNVEIERTFKRALICNPGNKDVLYEYCRFLLTEKKSCDAQKLWKTFHEKESVVTVDQCQSLALRFLLQPYVTEKDLERIELDVEVSLMDIDFDLLT